MKLTVRDVLGVGGLLDAKVAAGVRGLANNVASISVLEVAESRAARWMVPDELYVTSFYAIKDDVEMQKTLINMIAQCGCCGIILCHIGLWIKEVAQEILDLCDQLDFPLIIAKQDNSYADILHPIMKMLLLNNTEKEHRQYLQAENDSNTMRDRILELIVQEDDLKDILKRLNQMLHQKATYLDLYLECIYSDKPIKEVEAEIAYIKENFGLISNQNMKKDLYIWEAEHGRQAIALIKTSHSLFGFIIIELSSTNYSETNIQQIVDVLSMTCPLLFRRKEKMVLMKDYYLKEYLADLLVWNFPSEEIAIRRGLECGLDLTDKTDLIVVNINTQQKVDQDNANKLANYIKTVAMPYITELIRFYNDKGVAIYRSDTIIIFLEDKEGKLDLVKISQEVLNSFKGNKDIAASVGIADSFKQMKDISLAYNQAINAALIGREVFGEGQVTTYLNVWLYQHLRQMAADPTAKNMCLRLLNPLIEHDKKHQSCLVETLHALITYNMDMKKVADKLFIHRNTLLYRKNKIIEVLGYTPFVMPYLMNVLIALNVVNNK